MRWLNLEEYEKQPVDIFIDSEICERLGAENLSELEFFSEESELCSGIDYTEEEADKLLEAVDNGEIFLNIECGYKNNPYSRSGYTLCVFEYEGRKIVHLGTSDTGGTISNFFRKKD